MNGDRMFAGRISDCEKPRLELDQHIEIVKKAWGSVVGVQRKTLISRAHRAERTWPYEAPTTDARLKKRIVRTLIHEVVADMNHQHAPQSGLCVCYSIPSRAVRAANAAMNGEE